MNMQTTYPSLPISLDSSMINSFRSCKKRFYHNYLLNLHPQGKSVHLVAGAAFADAIDAARKYAYSTQDSTYAIMIEHAMRAFILQWKDYTPPEGHAKSFVNTFKAVELYLQAHPPLTDNIKPLLTSEGNPTTEFSFAIPLPIQHPVTNDPFIYCGRFDMLGKWDDQLLTILDEKTTSALGTSWLNQWDMRGQFIGYCWACQQLGYSVRQVAVRGVGILKTEIKFLTALQQYPQFLIDRWYEELLETIDEIKHSYKHNKFGYNFGDACGSYGGCSYKDLCTANEPERWMSNYEIRIWNPILREEKQPETL